MSGWFERIESVLGLVRVYCSGGAVKVGLCFFFFQAEDGIRDRFT